MPSIYSDRYMNNSWLRLPTYRYTRVYSQRKYKRSHRTKSGMSKSPPSDEGLPRVRGAWTSGDIRHCPLFEGAEAVAPLMTALGRLDHVYVNRKSDKVLTDPFMTNNYRDAGYALR